MFKSLVKPCNTGACKQEYGYARQPLNSRCFPRRHDLHTSSCDQAPPWPPPAAARSHSDDRSLSVLQIPWPNPIEAYRILLQPLRSPISACAHVWSIAHQVIRSKVPCAKHQLQRRLVAFFVWLPPVVDVGSRSTEVLQVFGHLLFQKRVDGQARFRLHKHLLEKA